MKTKIRNNFENVAILFVYNNGDGDDFRTEFKVRYKVHICLLNNTASFSKMIKIIFTT